MAYMTAILCPEIPTGNNIHPSTDNRLFGTIVEYNCPLGHYVNPNTAGQYNSLAIECLETKVWNFTAIPDCARELPSAEIHDNRVELIASIYVFALGLQINHS